MADKVAYIIAGPNGSGKTTFAKEFLQGLDYPFLNADEIALQLSPQNASKARLTAGKMFLAQLNEYIQAGRSFLFESTLAGGYLNNYIKTLKDHGFRVEIIYLILDSIEEGEYRIAVRVAKGGCPRHVHGSDSRPPGKIQVAIKPVPKSHFRGFPRRIWREDSCAVKGTSGWFTRTWPIIGELCKITKAALN